MRFASLAVIALAVAACGERVDETELCTETSYGNVSVPVLPTGFNWEWLGTETECFPGTQQLFPGGKDSLNKPVGETVVALTRDSVKLTLDFAFDYAIPRATYFDSVFKTKRDVERFEQTVGNVAREGGRVAIGNAISGRAFNNREAFGDSLQAALQRSAGGLIKIDRVYVRDMALPASAEAARERVYNQNLALDSVLKQRRIDSTNNVTKLQNAETNKLIRSLEAQVFQNAEYTKFKTDSARYGAMSNVCSGANTCILGQDFINTLYGQSGGK